MRVIVRMPDGRVIDEETWGDNFIFVWIVKMLIRAVRAVGGEAWVVDEYR